MRPVSTTKATLGRKIVEDIFPYPRQCIWLEQGRITVLRTRQNNDISKPFTPVDVLALSNEEAIIALSRDMMVASPTPGFTAELQGQIFNHDVLLKLELKAHTLFSISRSHRISESLGIHGEVFDSRAKEWMEIKAVVNLENNNYRWSLINCYLLGELPR